MPQNWFFVLRTSTNTSEVIPMSTKRIYRRVKVKDVSLEALKEIAIEKGETGTTVGFDVAKHEIVVVVRWPDATYQRPWSVINPSEIPILIELLCMLKEACGSLVIGLESTGTYSESVRMAMTNAFLEVHRVSGKGVSDYKEIFDGVPSQHDGKDAAMIAELTAYGKGTPWPFSFHSESEQEMRHQISRLEAFRNQANQWLGRLEGVLAKHWPELTGFLQLSSATLINICLHYGSPARIAGDEFARDQLRSWGRGRLSLSKIDAIIESARTTQGIPPGSGQQTWLEEIAEEAQKALVDVRACEKKLRLIAESNDSMAPYVKTVGAVTLCTIWSAVGDPRNYTSSGAFLKSLGLNLKELSSGKYQGKLRITKRGPGLARKLLYYWALRAIQEPALKSWYKNFQRVGRSSNTSEHRKMKGLVAMMRKLCRSLWYVYRHELEFDYWKVFPGKPLQKRKPRCRRKQVTSSN